MLRVIPSHAATTAQEVKRVSTPDEPLHRGDVVFLQKREPIKTFESVPCRSAERHRCALALATVREQVRTEAGVRAGMAGHRHLRHALPHLQRPNGSHEASPITSLDPLTIDAPITCPFCSTFTLKVVEGRILLK